MRFPGAHQGEWTTGLPSGRLTFLLTDVAGSTAAWEAYPDLMGEAMRRHDAIVESAVRGNRGVLVRPRGEGDSRFAVFREAADAVAAASQIVDALAAERWRTPDPIRVRSGVHTGSAELHEGDYYGPDVNRCARLRTLAEPGQVLVSAATAAAIGGDVMAGPQLRDLGVHQLKDIIQPERVFEVVTRTRG